MSPGKFFVYRFLQHVEFVSQIMTKPENIKYNDALNKNIFGSNIPHIQ